MGTLCHPAMEINHYPHWQVPNGSCALLPVWSGRLNWDDLLHAALAIGSPWEPCCLQLSWHGHRFPMGALLPSSIGDQPLPPLDKCQVGAEHSFLDGVLVWTEPQLHRSSCLYAVLASKPLTDKHLAVDPRMMQWDILLFAEGIRADPKRPILELKRAPEVLPPLKP
jgi:hypothetical protein